MGIKYKVVETLVGDGIENHNTAVCNLINESKLGGIHLTIIINKGYYISTIFYNKQY